MHWYTGDRTYDTALSCALAFALVIPILSAILPSSYGRFSTDRLGPRVNARLGWFVMELPSTVSFLVFYLAGSRRTELVPLVLLGLWFLHYANRGFLFPLLMRTARGEPASFSLAVVVAGWA